MREIGKYRNDSARHQKIKELSLKLQDLVPVILQLNYLINSLIIDDSKIQEIVRIVFGEFNICTKKGKPSRSTKIVLARHAYRFLSYNYTKQSLAEIGLNSCDVVSKISPHSVVKASIKAANNLIDTDIIFRDKILLCITKIQQSV